MQEFPINYDYKVQWLLHKIQKNSYPEVKDAAVSAVLWAVRQIEETPVSINQTKGKKVENLYLGGKCGKC